MIYAGIDIGSLTAEGAMINNKSIVATVRCSARPNPLDSAREVIEALEAESGLRWSQVAFTISTGYGREKLEQAGLARQNVSEISCHGYGAFALCPRVRTIIDIGGQDAKAIRVDDQGNLVTFAMNDKCAAGTGHFLELMCRSLEVPLDQLGPLSLGARRPVEVSSRCSIFIETEVIHFLQRGLAKADIAAGINRAMADRVVALVRRVHPEPEITMTGGVAKNIGVRRFMEQQLRVRMIDLGLDPQVIGALGAAKLARLRHRFSSRAAGKR